MSWSEIQPLLSEGTWDTLYMVGWATLFAVLGGLPLGVLLVLTDSGGALQNAWLNRAIGAVVNVGRSLPFIILLIALIPFTRLLVGTFIGPTAAIVPLAIGAIPFFARLVEAALREVDRGLVEAVQSMGGGTGTVVFKVLLPQSLPSLVAGLTTTVIVLIGYSAMAGAVSGGGLGAVALQYGYQRFETAVMVATVVALIVIVTLVQLLGDAVAKAIADRGGSRRSAKSRLSRLGGRKRVALAAAVLLPVGLLGYGLSSTGSNDRTVTVAASPAPHAEILEYVQKNLAEDAGVELRIEKFNDYVLPNTATESGEVDANFFQHKPYLDEFNEKEGTDIVPVVNVELEPLALYGGNNSDVEKLDDIRAGQTIAVPNDTTNGGRALHLLAEHDLITLKKGVGQEAKLSDIEDRKGLKFQEMDAPSVPRALDDVDAAVVNGNFALEVDLNPSKEALVAEDVKDNPYANFLAVKEGQQDDPQIRKLAKLLTSDKVKQFIEKKYQGAIVPAFGPVRS